MKIAVIGAGSVGGYFGGRLALAGNEVSFVARGEHLEAIKNNGLQVKSIKGDFLITPASAFEKIPEIGKVDLIILGVKAWQVKNISRQIFPLIGQDTMVMPLQNGVLAVDEICEYVDRKNVIGGTCKIASQIESPGVICHKGLEPTIVFGELDNSKTERIRNLKKTMDIEGMTSVIADNIELEIWKKFIMICLSGLGAVTRCTYGELRELDHIRRMMMDLMWEICRVAIKKGVSLEEKLVEQTMAFVDTMPHDTMSSMTRDVIEGRPSEIEYQNGSVVILGEKYHVSTPINKFIYECILPMENKARGLL